MASDFQIRLVSAPDAAVLPSSDEGQACQRWTRIATRVASGVIAVGYLGANWKWAHAFDAHRVITFAAGMTAGSVRPLSVALIDSDQENRPLSFDKGMFGFLTKFDVPIFLTLNIAEWITPEASSIRFVWLPAIFLHGGSVIAWELMQKLLENKANLGEKRPLFEGDTEGSALPFIVKGGLFLAAGAASAIFGGIQKSHAAWRLGFMGVGFGVGVTPAQQLFSRLKRLMDSFAGQTPAARRMQGIPAENRVLARLASLAPTVGKMGVSAVGAVLVTLPNASAKINVLSAVGNFFLGFPMALVDVAQQHRFQNPEEPVDAYEPILEGEEERCGPCISRVWREISSRPWDYVGVGGTAVLMTAMVVGNVVFPSENSILYASLLAGGAAATFGAGRIIEAIRPPAPGEENAIWNDLIFRGLRNAYVYGAALIPLLGIYVSGNISLLEYDFLWALYGGTVGASLHEMLTNDPALTPYISILYLLLFSVSSTLYIKGQI